MNANLPTTLAAAMLSMAPPSSIVHQIVSEERAQRIDLAMHLDKLADGYGARRDAAALRLQIQSNPQHWGTF